MKGFFKFIPLGIGISASVLYAYNIIAFKVINNSAALVQILTSLRSYLYVALIGFGIYFLLNIIDLLKVRKVVSSYDDDNDYEEPISYQEVRNENLYTNSSLPTYDVGYETPFANNSSQEVGYKPLYSGNVSQVYETGYETPSFNNNNINQYANYINEPKKETFNKVITPQNLETKNDIIKGNIYCYNCGEAIYSSDKYCSYCGACQVTRKTRKNVPFLRKAISLIEFVILILLLYFLISMMFSYKESKDPNFESPFKISLTK